MSPAISMQQQNLLLNLFIQPKASRDKIIGLHGNEIKLAITAPPIDGKANAYLIKFLSKTFKVPKSSVEIIKGELGRHKQVKVIAPQKIPIELMMLLS